jgi:peroxiredoxin Q/BCP
VEDFRKLGFQVVGCSTDSVEYNNKFAVEHNFTFPLISDESGRIAAAFNACNLVDEKPKKIRATCKTAKRVTFLVGRQGKILHRIDPFDPDTGVENLLTMIRTRGQRAQKKLRSG